MDTAQRQTQTERKEISDSRMLLAAIDLIVEKGPEQTTLKDVGEKAGYSRGLAGYRFGNKQGLFMFVLHSVGDIWVEQLVSKTKGKKGIDAICAALDAHQELCGSAPKPLEAFYRLWFEALAPESPLNEAVAGIHQKRVKDLQAWIEVDKARLINPNVDTHMVAEHFCAAVIGVVFLWMNNPKNKKNTHDIHQGVRLAMRAMLPVHTT